MTQRWKTQAPWRQQQWQPKEVGTPAREDQPGRQAPQCPTLCQPPLPPSSPHISTLTSHPGGKSAGQGPSIGGEAWAPSRERPRGHIPELQTAQLQGHALADLAGVALHVVIPELAGRKDEAETPTLIPCFPKQRPRMP